jgi:hypothetical protein
MLTEARRRSEAGLCRKLCCKISGILKSWLERKLVAESWLWRAALIFQLPGARGRRTAKLNRGIVVVPAEVECLPQRQSVSWGR